WRSAFGSLLEGPSASPRLASGLPRLVLRSRCVASLLLRPAAHDGARFHALGYDVRVAVPSLVEVRPDDDFAAVRDALRESIVPTAGHDPDYELVRARDRPRQRVRLAFGHHDRPGPTRATEPADS